MVRLLIAVYIVVVLVISAKAGAAATKQTSPLSTDLNYSSEAQ